MKIPSRAVTALVAACALATIVAACSLPVDDRATPLDPDQVGPDLVNTTTTTTTAPPTTVPVTTLTPPGTTDPQTSEPPTTTTTTQPLAVTKPVSLFYVVASGALQDLQRQLPESTTLDGVLDQLESPLPDLRLYGLTTSLQQGLIVGQTVSRGIATVELDGTRFDAMPEPQRQRVVGQIVLTLTSFVTVDQGAIGGVVLVIEGEGFEVFVPAAGNVPAGTVLTYEDFRTLIFGSPVTQPPATTTPPPPDTANSVPPV